MLALTGLVEKTKHNNGRMNMRLPLFASTAVMALAAGSAWGNTTLHVLHINDFHSRIQPINRYDSTCSAEDDAAGECFGGIARMYTIINDTRDALLAAGENVIVVDVGDQSQGSLFYTTFGGQAEADFMDMIGFDAMAVGNHEFDKGPEGLEVFLNTVTFPIVSSNLDLLSTSSLVGRVAPYTTLEVGGMQIGIVSALATDTNETSSPGDDIIFLDEIDALTAAVEALQSQGVSTILALNHVGFNADRRIAAAVPGLTAVIGGHSHTLLSSSDPRRTSAYPTWVDTAAGGSVPVVQAYAYGKYMGHLVLELDDDGGLVFASGDSILIDASITPNAEIAALVAEMAGPIDQLMGQVVAEASGDIDGNRDNCRAVECTMGNLVADAMLARVADQGITIAVQNGGGLRASIQSGMVTMGDIVTVLPFQNTLSTFETTGEVIVDALENGVSQWEDGAGRFTQVSGLQYSFDSAQPVGSRISDVMVMSGDAWGPIDPAATYGVVTNNYMRNGGDGYSMFAAHSQNAYDFGPDLADVLAEYLIANAPYQPYLDGRITQR
jgi:5'-nucleotidase/UDP-sugar diphosphatase